MFDGDVLIHCNICYPTGKGVRPGPPHVDTFDHIVLTQSEVQCRGSMRQVGVAKLYLPDLRSRCSPDRHPGADSLKVLFDAKKVNTDEVIIVVVIVTKHRGRVAVVGNEYIDLAVGIVVGADQTAPLGGMCQAQFHRSVGKGAVAIGHEQT